MDHTINVQVFKGQLTDKTKVAIKWITIKPNADVQEIKTQMDVLCKLRHHRHLVSILGYCIEENFAGAGDEADVKKSQSLYVVSEFVEHGDHLRSLLNSKKSLLLLPSPPPPKIITISIASSINSRQEILTTKINCCSIFWKRQDMKNIFSQSFTS
jgi:serine/threonine protein kinase